MSHEFKISLDGVSLSPEQESALRVAIQRVVMDHIADLDFGGDRRAAILPLMPNGSTQGMEVVVADSTQVQRAVDGMTTGA